MFAYVHRPVFLSHKHVLKDPQLVPRHIRLGITTIHSAPGARWRIAAHSRFFIDVAFYGRRAANVMQRRFSCMLSFCRINMAVVRRTLHRDDFVVCRRASIRLRLSCRERRAETILPSATAFLGNRDVVSVVSFLRRLALQYSPRISAMSSVNFSCFTSYFLTLRERRHFYLLSQSYTLHDVDSHVSFV